MEDAQAAVAAGVDALGFNFVPTSKRCVSIELARAIIEQVRGQVLSVAVVANLAPAEVAALFDALGVDRVQLHGDEAPEDVRMLAPRAFKALRVASPSDIELAAAFPSHPLLIDAKVEGQLGGTGKTTDWHLVAPLAASRPVILAGGLTPDNVARAVQLVRPWGVDAASSVETDADPRWKDPDKIRRFVSAARRSSH